jgi:hypothetical protein
MSVRQLRDIEVWIGKKDRRGNYNGEWVKTKGVVSESELCHFPLCNRKIPSKRSKMRSPERKIPQGYCSIECRKKHKKNAHRRSKLSQFLEEKSI